MNGILTVLFILSFGFWYEIYLAEQYVEGDVSNDLLLRTAEGMQSRKFVDNSRDRICAYCIFRKLPILGFSQLFLLTGDRICK